MRNQHVFSESVRNPYAKRCRTLLLTIALGAVARPAQCTGPAFAIFPSPVHYWTKDGITAVDLMHIELSPEPCITDADITGYDWEKHEMRLSKEGAERFRRFTESPVYNTIFVVVADGVRCYRGAFWSIISSVSCGSPVIRIDMPGSIRIDRAYPCEKFTQEGDPRSDPRVHAALKRAGKLVETRVSEGKSVR